MERLVVYVDGAIAGNRHTGIAAVARDERGQFLGWLSRQLPRMTNNEAEYRAALLGLELARELGAAQVDIVSDSEVVVRQMSGASRVNSPRLKELHRQTCRAAAEFEGARFVYVGREANRLADALATEALGGRLVSMPGLQRLEARRGRADWWRRTGEWLRRPAEDE
jgi:ribonuclease HI